MPLRHCENSSASHLQKTIVRISALQIILPSWDPVTPHAAARSNSPPGTSARRFSYRRRVSVRDADQAAGETGARAVLQSEHLIEPAVDHDGVQNHAGLDLDDARR